MVEYGGAGFMYKILQQTKEDRDFLEYMKVLKKKQQTVLTVCLNASLFGFKPVMFW